MASTSPGMTSKPHSIARITSDTPLWHPLADGRKAKISVGMRKATTKTSRMVRQRRRRKLERGRRRFEGSRRQKRTRWLEH